MPTELPIACSLSAAELPTRLAEMAALGREALLDVSLDARHARLWFTPGDGVRRRLDEIVAAESHCCAFLTMRVTDEPNAVRLEIDAPEGAEIVLAELVDAFGPHVKAV